MLMLQFFLMFVCNGLYTSEFLYQIKTISMSFGASLETLILKRVYVVRLMLVSNLIKQRNSVELINNKVVSSFDAEISK